MTTGLTPRQWSCLDAIVESFHVRNIAPTVSELCDALSLGRSAVHQLLTQLEERGHIRRLPYRARAIELVQPAVEPAVVNIVLTPDNVLVRAKADPEGSVQINYHRLVDGVPLPVPEGRAA